MALFSNQPITPAVREHINAQYALFRDMSQKMFDSAQKINELNIQAARAMFEESLSNTQEVMCANDPFEAISIAAGQAQPNAEKLRAYQQHLTNIAAGTQVDLARTAESHVPETSRAAAAMADDVARRTAEETERTRQRQRAAMERATAPAQPHGGQSAQAGQQPQQPQRGAEAKGAGSRAGA